MINIMVIYYMKVIIQMEKEMEKGKNINLFFMKKQTITIFILQGIIPKL